MGLAAHYSKPVHAKWSVESKAEGVHHVYRPDGSLYGTYATRSQAAATAGIRQKEDDAAARRTTRACMTCGKPFASEGIHNRMCTPCRGLNADGWNPYSIAPRNGRAK